MIDLLLIDDDKKLTELLGGYLSERGYNLSVANNGADGLKQFFADEPNLVVLDVSMPERSGWFVLKRIRELSSVPVIMITAHNEEEDVLRGFEFGADDYVAKPFSFAELAARIMAVLNRANSATAAAQTVLTFGDLTVDMTDKRVWRGSETIHLTPTEFKLLEVLIRNAGRVVTQEELIRQTWGEQYMDDIGYVRRYVWHLRKKIEPDPNNPHYIHNDRGYGYRFQVQSKAAHAG
ncbi:MAG: response regulator transcription factor [Caldilinea sp.]|nr:response regulator transcription factor [Caldilinea sp.]MCB0055936.1 response regulator transcription factor [Caldilineaceae bacterium]MCB0038153.1 response regulator transcription factor [Caldilinea sp.]MCB0050924.1 response regulator transcription factor [Caldilinea sp.]MCB0066391.1 response regulator transcription factor [Caldilineaceae bacterium]